jgi:hypothetical protein
MYEASSDAMKTTALVLPGGRGDPSEHPRLAGIQSLQAIGLARLSFLHVRSMSGIDR